MWSIVSISRRVRETRATHERVLILHFIVSVFMQAIACLFRFPQRHHRPRSTQYTMCRSFLLATPARIALFSLPFFPRRQRRCDFSGRVSFFLPGRVHRANRTVHGVFPFFSFSFWFTSFSYRLLFIRLSMDRTLASVSPVSLTRMILFAISFLFFLIWEVDCFSRTTRRILDLLSKRSYCVQILIKFVCVYTI